MPGRPEVLDNLTPETRHAVGLGLLVNDLQGRPVAVATGFVNLAGLHELATLLADNRPVRLLLGAEPDPGLGVRLPLTRFETALAALGAERDLARFPPSRAAATLANVDAWLAGEHVEVRRYLDRFLHGKAYLFGTVDDARAALVTSANLTAGGLFSNLELGVVDYTPSACTRAIEWFDDLWGSAAEYKDALRRLLFPDVGLLDPETVYLRALLDLYGEELDTEAPPRRDRSTIDLASFQVQGFERARGIVARHHGVVYADGVGTGKTEIGLAFIEEYALRQGHHALVITPAQLKRNWEDRIHQALLPAQVVSYQELASDEQLVPTAHNAQLRLANAFDSYRLVVVDEAQALRNPDTTWYRAMTKLLGGARKDVLLLTATPINNGLWDLYHLTMVFARHDRAFSAIGVPSVRDLFVAAGANERDPGNLDPDRLFPLADAISVRRDRRFIEEHFPNATFSDGTPVRFPRPRLSTRRYDLDESHPGLVLSITTAMANLTMARYRPSAYEVSGAETSAEATLGALLLSGLLKRFESSWWSCLRSVNRRIAEHDAFLAAWEHGYVLTGEVLREAALAELDEGGLAEWVADQLAGDVPRRPIAEFEPGFVADVLTDRDQLLVIQRLLAGLSAETDPKLAEFRDVLEHSASQKVIVFSTFGDTIRYLDEHLPDRFSGRDRVVVIGTESEPDERTRLLARLSPQTVVRPDYVPPDGEVDLLLSTDVLSEGQNLQQAGAVVSYDMPWNPQRVVQRNGRVIRLKSPHDEVALTTMLPEPGDLEAILRLESTIRRKIFAASVYGMESGVIEGMIDPELRAFSGRLEGNDVSLLDDEEETAPGFGGEELRALLARLLAEGEIDRLRRLPWGIGAAFRQGDGVPSVGSPGIFFACRTPGGQRYWRFVEPSGELVTAEAEMLRRIVPGNASGLDGELPPGMDLEVAWSLAAATIVEEHNRRADPHYAAERIGPAQRFALDLLRNPNVTIPAGAALAVDALSVERSSIVRGALNDIRGRLAAAELTPEGAALEVVHLVEEFGLQPVPETEPLEPVEVDDLGVVCWMAVLPPVGPIGILGGPPTIAEQVGRLPLGQSL